MLTPKDIVVYLEPGPDERLERLTAHAAKLASVWKAHLVVAFVPEDVLLSPYAGFVRGGAITTLSEDSRLRTGKSAEFLRSVLGQIERQYEVSTELRVCNGERDAALMLHARHAGLALLEHDREPTRHVSTLSISEEIVLASGRPSLLLPSNWPLDWQPRKILIGWNASREAARAISDAMPFLQRATDVHVAVVPEVNVNQLLGEDPGTDISRHLARYAVSVTLDRLEGDNAGKALLDHALTIGADMMVMGAYGQPKIREFVFGSATQSVLANLERPVLLSR
ncbi:MULTISPECIES: universal stress protein [Brucella]|uniref:Universal stress protein n=1 Tax=Brucella pseudogrignonensis TaxID=419475 RepID=A0A7Y3T2U7_9HYPH|nr:universal stress protein [Brucella pseudogrignonensis]NNV19100.1 universal stress protein [Brucella pseudogrignonensis]